MNQFAKRFGVGLVGALLGAFAQYFAAGDFTKLGIFAGLAATLAALVATAVQKLADKVSGA